MTFIKHVFWSLRSLLTYYRPYFLQIILGFVCLLLVLVLQDNIEQRLKSQGKDLIGGDISISTRGKWNTDVKSILNKTSSVVDYVENLELTTMVRGEDRSILVNLSIIEESYPFYGEILLSDNKSLSSIHRDSKAIVYSEVLSQLGLSVGESIYIGNQDFEIYAIIKKDAVSSGFSGLAPKIIISSKFTNDIGLIGDLSSERRRFIVKAQENFDIKILEQSLLSSIMDSSIRIRTYLQVNDQTSRILTNLSNFMGLIAIVCLLMSFLASLYVFRFYLLKEFRNIAILSSLGYSIKYIKNIYRFKITIFSFFLAILSFLILILLKPFFLSFILNNFDKTLDVNISIVHFIYCLIISLVFNFLVYFSFENNLSRINAIDLLRGNFKITILKRYLLLGAFLFWLTSFFLTKSYLISLLFFVSILLFFVIIIILARSFIFLFYKIKTTSFALNHFKLLLYRSKSTYLFLSLSLSLGICLLTFIPNLRYSLLSQVVAVESKPDLFLFDIQDFQVKELSDYLSEKGYELSNLSPMIRARLISINDEVVKNISFDEVQTREDEESQRFRNRAFNLSYRSGLSPYEKIRRGISFEEYQGDIPAVSLEHRFARRIGAKLNDRIKLDLLGVDLEAKVIQLRSVNWFSMQPNFFVLFDDGILNDAPKTFLATIGGLSEIEKDNLQFLLSSEFNNISMVDLKRVTQRIIDLMQDFELVLVVLSFFSVFLGILVFASIYYHFMQSRKSDVQIWKVLGLNRLEQKRLFFVESLVLLFKCVLLGAILGLFLSWLIVVWVFDWTWSLDLKNTLLIIGLIGLITMLISTLVQRSIFNKSPLELLKNI